MAIFVFRQDEIRRVEIFEMGYCRTMGAGGFQTEVSQFQFGNVEIIKVGLYFSEMSELRIVCRHQNKKCEFNFLVFSHATMPAK